MTRKNNYSKQKLIKIGIVGTGFGERVHVPAFRLCEGCKVEAICSSTPQKALESSLRLKIPYHYENWKEMVASPHIDAISIATPPSIQTEIALSALLSGKAVFAEKPLALNVHDAKKICATAGKKNLPNMIDFEFPEILQWQQTRDMLQRRTIGRIRRISVNWHTETYANKNKVVSWKTSLEKGGGTLYNFVSHVFHYLEWFMGPIAGLSVSLFKNPGDERSGDTSVTMAILFKTGIPCSVSVSTNSFLANKHCLEFYGENGTIVLDNSSKDHTGGFSLKLGTRSSGKFRTISSSSKKRINKDIDGRINQVSCISKRFIKWIRTGIPQRPNFQDGLRVQKLIEKALLSSNSGKWVKVTSK